MGLYNNRIVVKVGTSTLTNDAGKSDLRATDRLVCTLADIHNMGYEVILVSSGAIAVGRNKLGMHSKPDSMRMKQAAAAVGQCSLMYLYDKFFGDYDKTVAQILLNAEDIEQEEKKENLTNTFDALLEMGVIPIVNENDSVSYTEIESEDRLFGDNDMLSSVVAVLCRAKTGPVNRPCLFRYSLVQISFSKLWPSVRFSKPKYSRTVAPISAKVVRVPRLAPGRIFLLQASMGVYSREWSVDTV